jgi:hypothetical protein
MAGLQPPFAEIELGDSVACRLGPAFFVGDRWREGLEGRERLAWYPRDIPMLVP